VEIKQAACRLPLEEFLELQCNANTCPYGGSCVEDTTIKSCKITSLIKEKNGKNSKKSHVTVGDNF